MSCEVEFIKRLQIPSLILISLFTKEDLLQLFTDIQGGKIIAPVNLVPRSYSVFPLAVGDLGTRLSTCKCSACG